MSKLQRVTTMPRQSLTAMKVAFGVRAQYATILGLTLLMVTQIIGVVIFSGKALANGSVTYDSAITDGFGGALDGPSSIAMAPDDTFYVASITTNKITKYNASGVAISAFGTNGTGDGQFDGPTSMAVDKGGYLYVFDKYNHRVQKFDSSGTFVTKWGSEGSGDGQFGYFGTTPTVNGIAVAPNGDVYIGDDWNSRIQVFSNTGTFLRSWSTAGQTDVPRGIAIDPSGRVWVCTTHNSSGVFAVYSANGLYQEHPDDSNVASHPCMNLTINKAGDVFLLTDHTGGPWAYKFNSEGYTTTYWQSTTNLVNGIAVNSQGKIFVTNETSDRIQVYNDQSAYIGAKTAAATGVSARNAKLNGEVTQSGVTAKGFQFGKTTNYELPGLADTSAPTISPFAHVGQPGSGSSQVLYSSGVAIAPDGNYYVSVVADQQTGPNIKKYNPAGSYIGGINTDSYNIEPGRMTFDSAGNLYVFNTAASQNSNDVIWKFDSSGALVDSWASSGSGAGQLGNGTDIVVDSHDNVYVQSNNRVNKFDSSGTFITRWGGAGTGDGQFDTPGQLAVGADDSVYVADSINNRIQKFDSNGTFITKWGSAGTGPGQFKDNPYFLTIFGNNVYVADFYQNRYLTFTSDGDFVRETMLEDQAGSPITPQALKVDARGNIILLKRIGFHTIDAVNVYKPNTQVVSRSLTGLDCGTTYHYRSYATNTYGTVYGEDQQFTTNACMAITTESLPDANLAEAYDQLIETNGPEGEVYISADGDDWLDLPPGMYITSSGHVAGTPTAAGTYTFTVRAEDQSANNTGMAYKEFSLFVTGETLAVVGSSNTIPPNVAYTDQVEITGGIGNPVFSLEYGEFPPGISMDSNGVISGTPTNFGSYAAGVKVTEGPLSDIAVIGITVDYGNAIQMNGGNLQPGQVGAAYTSSYIANAPYYGFGYKTFQITAGSLPPGLVMDLDGTVHGTPTAFGGYEFTVEVSDLTGTASAEFYLTIFPLSDPRVNTPMVTISSPASNTSFDYLNDDVTITGTGPINQTITVFMDTYQLGTTSSDSNGNWSYVANDVFPGNHSFDAKWIPGEDVAFVSDFAFSSYSSEVKVIDTATRQVVKTILLPQNSVATYTTINHAGTKVYISGYDISTYESQAWEFDIVTGVLGRTLTFTGYSFTLGEFKIELDDQSAYVSKVTQNNLEIIKIDLAAFSVVGTPLAIPMSGPEWNWVRSGYSTVPMVLSGQSLYTSVSSSNTGTSDITVVNTINQATSGITALNEVRVSNADMRLIAKSGDKVYVVINGKIIVVNVISGNVIHTVDIEEFDTGDHRPVSLAVDAASNKAFVGVTLGLYSIDIASGDADFVSLPGTYPYNEVPYSIDLTSDAAQLYISTLYRNVSILDTATGQLVAAPNLTPNAYSGQASSVGNFVDQIVPPAASTTFSVGLAPNVTEALKICSGYEKVSIPVNQSYSRQTCTTGGSGPKTFTLGLDPLPTGLSLDSGTGEIAGTPTISGTYGFSVTVTDSTGSDTREYTIVVLPEENPTITDATPAPAAPVATPPKSNRVKAPQTVVAAQNNIFALAKRIPEPFAIGFPWFLLALALGLVGIQYYQVHTESKSTKRMQASVAKQERLVEEQNNFVALSTHYLHTPLTVMEGEISLMVKAGTLTQAEATKLQATLTSLNAEAEAALAQEEQDKVE